MVRGVRARDMLRAQAIVARTYAWARSMSRGHRSLVSARRTPTR